MSRSLIVPVLVATLVLVACIIAVLSWWTFPVAVGGASGPMVCADDSVSSPVQGFESALDDVSVITLSRKPVMLKTLGGDTFTVVVFCAYSCPCSDGYAERLQSLQRDFTPDGVAFIAIHSSADEDIEAMQRYIRRREYPLPVYRDEHGLVADAMGATVTPEVFLFDASWRLRYHGRIDDEKSGGSVTHHTLRLALDTLLSGVKLEVIEQAALGCAIVRSEAHV